MPAGTGFRDLQIPLQALTREGRARDGSPNRPVKNLQQEATMIPQPHQSGASRVGQITTSSATQSRPTLPIDRNTAIGLLEFMKLSQVNVGRLEKPLKSLDQLGGNSTLKQSSPPHRRPPGTGVRRVSEDDRQVARSGLRLPSLVRSRSRGRPAGPKEHTEVKNTAETGFDVEALTSKSKATGNLGGTGSSPIPPPKIAPAGP